jgi:hypothetical protein
MAARINRQFQDLHRQSATADWVLKQHVERDICLLYRQLANYSYIMGDLYYGPVFALPYWEYLDLPGLDDDDRKFIRDGCLVMILAMTSDLIDGSGHYLRPHVASCEAALNNLTCDDEDTSKLVHTVKLALHSAIKGESESQELADRSLWVHKRYVRGYFERIAKEFQSNPYFHK